MSRLNIRKPFISVLVLCPIFIGCNDRPWTLGDRWYNPVEDDFEVNTEDPAEVQAVTGFQRDYIQYRQSLVQLKAFYDAKGDYQRREWAEKERKNLDRAHNVDWEGIGEVSAESPVPSADLEEDEIVEIVISSRNDYLDSLDRLASMLESREDEHRAYVIQNILRRFHPEETYMYLLSAEVPPENLRPMEVIPEANELYLQALELHRKGRKVPAAADYEKERKALVLLKRLVRNYPKSTRIAHAAFYIGEIYKEYFREHYLAVKWYERALQWDPTIPLPVRFQTAVQLDFNLNMKQKALKYYRDAVKYERPFRSNTRYSLQRIGEIQEMLAEERAEEMETNAG